MCGSGRSRPNTRRTTGLATATKAGTTTTTPRRRCSLCGTFITQPCVTTGKPAGETWMSLKSESAPQKNIKWTPCCVYPPQMSSGVRLWSYLHIWAHHSSRCSTWARLRPASLTTKPNPAIHADVWSTAVLWASSGFLSTSGPRSGRDASCGASCYVAARKTAGQFVRTESANHRWVQREESKPGQRYFLKNHIGVKAGGHHQSRTCLMTNYVQ